MCKRLKIWPQFFEAVVTGHKKSEVRVGDRGLVAGDQLRLLEWSPSFEHYTGSFVDVRITHVLSPSDYPNLGNLFVYSFELVGDAYVCP